MRLYQIQDEVHRRVGETESSQPEWPCRKGCDQCCRSLAAVPLVSRAEWERIASAIDRMPADLATRIRENIAGSALLKRPLTCPLLDTDAGSCQVYDARPIVCRAYGFYAERESVLGCSRIEAMATDRPDVVWGNHDALQHALTELGDALPLFQWLRFTRL